MPGGEQDGSGAADSRRWLVLGVIALAQLMIVLDKTYPGANMTSPA